MFAALLMTGEVVIAQADECYGRAFIEMPASLAQVTCVQEVASKHVENLASVFETAKTQLAEGRSEAFLTALVGSQNDWERYAETACEADALIYERGTLKEWRRAHCYIRIATERTAYLTDLIEEPKN